MKKWTVRILLIVLVLFILGMAGAFLFINSIVKTGFETVGPKITKVDMRLGSAKISAFSGSCQLKDLFVGNPEGFRTPSSMKVGNIKVAMNVRSVFSDLIQVNEVNIQAPEITLEKSLTGSNIGKILENLKSTSSQETTTPKSEKNKAQKNIYIKDLVIEGGRINMSVTALGGKALSVSMPPIHLTNIGTKEKGVTIAEASSQIMQSVLVAASKAAEKSTFDIGNSLKGIGNGAKEGATKAVEGLKGLFK